MNNINDIIMQIKKLRPSQLETLTEKLFSLLQTPNDELVFFSDSEPICGKCGCSDVFKYGKDKNGKQRYKCKTCGPLFVKASHSVVSKTHKSYDTWKTYIICTLKGFSLKDCAKECSISVQTAFLWRHKILNALQKDQNSREMGGIVEIDDLYVGISYKGNHKNSKRFTMPRDPYKRSRDNKLYSCGRACVMCAVERNGQSYGEVIGVGHPNFDMLSFAFDNRVIRDSIVLTDKATGFTGYFNKSPNIELIQLDSHSVPGKPMSPPEVKGAYHIQNVNNLHYRFRRFIFKYNGVATKYLNHYVGLFIWIENHKRINNINLEDTLISNIAEKGTYMTRNELLSLPVIPNVA